MATKNLYHRRLVAESGARPCWICYKLSSTVLITPESDDWFHICAGHLNDAKFAVAKDAEDAEKKRHDEAIEKEIEAVKKEYEEKMRKKLEKRKKKDQDKDGAKSEEKRNEAREDEEDEKAKQEKLKDLEQKKEPAKAKVEGPRLFELQKNFFQMRLQRKRDLEAAKRTRERLQAPGAFPSVPSGLP